MRIGLYGALANAGYTLTCVLRKAGYDAEYVHDGGDRYPMSQPLWEEAELVFDPARLPNDLPAASEWAELARRSGWDPPSWIVDVPPARLRELPWPVLRRGAALAGPSPARARAARAYLAANAGLIRRLATYDWLVVCGLGVVAAHLSGTRYLYWPNGGELRLLPFRDETPADRFVARSLRAAIGAADVAGTHDPTLADCFDRLGRPRVPFLPFLVDTERWAPTEPDELGRELKRRAGDRLILFQAARQDVRWKGTDRFVHAFVRAVRDGARLFLVVSPWGEDAGRVGELLQAEVPDAVHVLDGIPSKPLLGRLYGVADVVVDQFALGVHGATMLEAMACATPVLISLDADRYRDRWHDYRPPPVLDASSEDEIHAVLRALDGGRPDLAQLGADARRWVEETHGVAQARRFVPERVP